MTQLNNSTCSPWPTAVGLFDHEKYKELLQLGRCQCTQCGAWLLPGEPHSRPEMITQNHSKELT
jgi:hypothetical protein